MKLSLFLLSARQFFFLIDMGVLQKLTYSNDLTCGEYIGARDTVCNQM